MNRLVISILLFAVGALLRPPAPEVHIDGARWSAATMEAALLGRRMAAADLAWIGLVQTLGSRVAERAGFPTVANEVDVVTTLDPQFALAYHFGVIVVLTNPERADRLSTILERGRAAFPRDSDFPRMMGFLEHFGRLNFPAAAARYRESVALGGPAYLTPLANRLENAALQCSQLRDELANAAARAGSDERELLLARAGPVLSNCEKTRLESIVGQFKLNQGRIPTLDEVLEQGHEPPIHLPGQCWTITPEGRARLEPCR